MGIKHGISWDLLSGIHNGPWESNYVNHGIDHGNTMEYSMGLKKSTIIGIHYGILSLSLCEVENPPFYEVNDL